MRKLLSLFLALALILACCPLASAATTYNYTTQEKDELEKFLSKFQWYWNDYNGANPSYTPSIPGAGSSVGILSGITQNPLAVDYSIYPVEQPDLSWDARKDPRGKWGGYWKFSESAVNWVLTYVFSLSQSEIASMNAKLDAGGDPYVYRYNGYYYSWPGGVGGGFEATVKDITYDGYYYRVTYHLYGGDGFWEDMGFRFAVFSKTSYNGKQYWSLRYNGKTELAPDMPFLDVSASSYYAGDIAWAYKNNITSGTTALTFGADTACTRAQAVTFLWRAADSPTPSANAPTFSDVSAGSYYEKAVRWAAEKGITGGTGNGKFSPNAKCSRAQIVSFLYRAAGSPSVSSGASFSDVPASQYYYNAVRWAVANKITTGTGNGKFSPDSPCTRGQIAAFLHRASSYEPEETPSWYGTFVRENGETLTVTNVTSSNVYLTAKALDAAGDWYEINRVLTFVAGSKTVASIPFRSGDSLLVYYNLKSDRITVDYPEGWWPDQDFMRQ